MEASWRRRGGVWLDVLRAFSMDDPPALFTCTCGAMVVDEVCRFGLVARGVGAWGRGV